MNSVIRGAGCMIAAASLLSACASSPKKIEAAHVPLHKYAAATCDQIGLERTAIQYRANLLYHSLQRRANADAVKMGLGVALFLPILFALKGDKTQAAEFAQLKGDYQTLRITAEDKGCAVEFADFDEVVSAKTVTAELAVDTTS